MPIDGSAFAGVASRVRRFLGGKTPLTLVPFAAPGVPLWSANVEGVHEKEAHKIEMVEGVAVNVSMLKCWVAERLGLTMQFLYNDWIWQVSFIEFDKAAGSDWPHYVELTGQARGAKQVLSD